MDNSTIIFIATLILAILVLRWFISPIPQSVPDEFNIPDPSRLPLTTGSSSRQRRQVTDSMIEVVQAIGPQLSVSQIRHSLESTGSVEATVELLMEAGNLPLPPGEIPLASTTGVNTKREEQNGPEKSLLEKYNVQDEARETSPAVGKWGKDENERIRLLRDRKAEMILKARKNMEAATISED